MTKQTYNDILKNIIKSNEAKDAMYIIENFNMNLLNEQLHMLKVTQVAESIIYPYFIKFNTKTGSLPVPSPGKKFVEQWVKPHEMDEYDIDDEEYCTLARFSSMLLTKEDFVNTCGMKEIQNELNKLRINKLDSIKKEDLLNLMDNITLTADPCDICIWEKKTFSKKLNISCIGIKELC